MTNTPEKPAITITVLPPPTVSLNLSDDRGNTFEYTDGFVSIECNNRKQDVNAGKIFELGKIIGGLGARMAAEDRSGMLKVGQRDSIYGTIGGLLMTAGESNTPDAKINKAPLFKSFPAIEGFEVHLHLRTNENLPSPLSNICTAAKSADLIRDSR